MRALVCDIPLGESGTRKGLRRQNIEELQGRLIHAGIHRTEP